LVQLLCFQIWVIVREIAAGNQEDVLPRALLGYGFRKLLAECVGMVSHDDGNQVKGAKNTLEKGELDFEGVLLIMGLGQIASETLVPKETVHKIAPDRDDTERGAEAALVVDARPLKMSPMTGARTSTQSKDCCCSNL